MNETPARVEIRKRLCGARPPTIVLVIAAALLSAACSDDPDQQFSAQPIPAERRSDEAAAQAQQQQQEAMQGLAQQQDPIADRQADRADRRASSASATTEAQPPEGSLHAIGAAEQQASYASGQQVDDHGDHAEPHTAAQEAEVDQRLPTSAPGRVKRAAVLRKRPGLAWPAINSLAAGEPVQVLQRIGGWSRISLGDGVGWVRSSALDLGETEEHEIDVQPTPSILAEWRGVEYGVMGQSADGAEIRLLSESEEVVSAVKDEVTLLAEDITVDDLPVLIGDETVVFPGDDFRAGQGKILPRADEWMWLPWGWLLAHNEEFIWQWRPETDELELVRRPPGAASLSPDGSHIAIANLCSDPTDECSPDRYLTLLPLDGSAPVTLGTILRRAGWSPKLSWSQSWFHDLEWAANNKAVRMSAKWTEGNAHTVMSLVVHLDGRLVRFDEWGSLVFGDRDCRVVASFPGSYPDPWNLYPDNTVRGIGDCLNQDGAWEEGTLVFSLAGEFLRFDLDDDWAGDGRNLDPGLPMFEELGSDIEVIWSPSGSHALVTSNELRSLWLFDAEEVRLREIEINHEAYPEGADWGRGEGLLSWHAAWHEDERLAAMWHWGGVSSGGYMIEVADGEITPLEFWSHGLWSSLTFAAWNPSGTVLKIRFDRIPVDSAEPPGPPGDGLARRGAATSVTAFVSDDGEPPHFFLSDWKTPQESWSPNGHWFATLR